MRPAKTPSYPKRKRKKENQMHWQTGDFSRHLQYSTILPEPFLILCKLADITPAQMLSGFIQDISFSSYQREISQSARKLLIEYFLAKKIGQEILSEQDWRSVFNDFHALCFVWPTGSDESLITLSEDWRKEYFSYLFSKWEHRRVKP